LSRNTEEMRNSGHLIINGLSSVGTEKMSGKRREFDFYGGSFWNFTSQSSRAKLSKVSRLLEVDSMKETAAVGFGGFSLVVHRMVYGAAPRGQENCPRLSAIRSRKGV